MCVTMHHGHWLGGQKCKGDQALCAQCLRTGLRGDRIVHDGTALPVRIFALCPLHPG